MIVTVTLNPSVDKTIHLPKINLGKINRANSVSIDPGGKGVNVSRALKSFGANTSAVLVCGQLSHSWFQEALEKLDLPHTLINVSGTTRTNFTLVESSETVTKINEPGFYLDQKDIENVKKAIASHELTNSWVVLAGKLNPGLDPDTYSKLAIFAKEMGAKIALDTSGEELRLAIRSGAIDLIKPNLKELSDLVGEPIKSMQEAIKAARNIISAGVPRVLCSLGSDGAILVTSESVVHCESTKKFHGIPVGSGDILLAIFLGAGANVNALEKAVSWATASVPLDGTAIPLPSQASEIQVKSKVLLDENRELLGVD